LTFLYVGNRTPRPASWETAPPSNLGIGIFRYDDADGGLDYVETVAQDVSVGAACIDTRRNVYYCVHETMTLPGYGRGGGGQICAFAVDARTGDLTALNRQPSHGTLPTYVALDGSGRYLLAVNHTGHTPVTRSVRDASGAFRVELQYDDATTVLYRLDDDGSIGEACDVFRHDGKGGPLPLQTHSQLHAVERSPSGNVFVVCDKGSDEIAVFRIDRENARLVLCGDAAHKSVPGSSPRYCVFHPKRPYFYVNHETLPIVSAWRYDENGDIEHVNTLQVTSGQNAGGPKLMQSDIRIHPSGNYLYDLVRGSNEAKVLAIDSATGDIDVIQTAKLDCDGPRACSVSPDGRFLVIAAYGSKEVVVWQIGPDGRIAPAHCTVAQPFPSSVTFLSPRKA
jgi:6-phosphogluconolactonase (cycloisomerase 2 family)